MGAGNDRLARITKTGRGEEADTLYSTPPKGQGRELLSNDDEILRTNTGVRRVTREIDDDPQDIDISQQQQQQEALQNNPFLAMMQGQQGAQQADQISSTTNDV